MIDSFQVYFSFLPAISQERFDPLSKLLTSAVSAASFEQAYIFAQLALFTFGLVLLLTAQGRSIARAVFCSCAAALSLTFVLGWEVFLLKLHYFPLLLAAMTLPVSATIAGALTILVGFFWIITAGSAAVFGVLLAAGFASLLRSSKPASAANGAGAILLIIIGAAVIPTPHTPDYPPDARVSIDNILSALPQPYIGPSRQFNCTDFSKYRSALSSHTLRAALLCLLLVLAAYGGRYDDRSRLLLLFSTLILVLVGSDSIIPAEALQYSPLQVISRLVPGLQLLVVPSILYPIAITGLIAALGHSQTNLRFEAGMVLVLIISVVDTLSGQTMFGLAPMPQLGAKYPLSSNVVEFSESAAVVEHFGGWVTQPGIANSRDFERLDRLQRGRDFEWTANAQPRPDLAKLAIDGNTHTRWRTVRPQQPGDWISVKFDRVVPVVKIVLSVRAAPSDYSRGFKFYTIAADGTEDLTVDHTPWRGPVLWTENGYPYFGRETMVIVDLPKQQEIVGFRAVQSAHARFDWTVGEIKLWKLP
ncbi:MAG: hypothetical protein KDD66_08955 [Bdellovibrionales bacterium]|nr:hypothetical protein [Bdellovibrionales bacterium]